MKNFPQVAYSLLSLLLVNCSSDSSNEIDNEDSTTKDIIQCNDPSNLLVQSVVGNTADITWSLSTNNATSELQFGNSDFTIGSGTTVSSAETSIQLNDLVGSTAYDVYVRSKCSDIFSNWVGPITFTTDCFRGVFDGNVSLRTQQEIDDFGANCYTTINGYLSISDSMTTGNEIVDLSPLSTIEYVTLGLAISNTSLTSLNGLERITKVWELFISKNQQLSSLSGLEALTEINGGVASFGISILDNDDLTSLSGLGPISKVWLVDISGNESLNSIQALSTIKTIEGNVSVLFNDSLTSLDGLNGLETIGGGLSIRRNPLLINLDPLQNLTDLGTDLVISENPALLSITGIGGLTGNVGSVTIEKCISLPNLNGIPSLNLIDASVNIDGLDSITDLEGLTGTMANGVFAIVSNRNLVDLKQLSELTSVGGFFSITNNDALQTLNGLENLTFAGGEIQIGGNDQLSDFCALTNLITNGTISGMYIVTENAFDHYINDIENGNCSN